MPLPPFAYQNLYVPSKINKDIKYTSITVTGASIQGVPGGLEEEGAGAEGRADEDLEVEAIQEEAVPTPGEFREWAVPRTPSPLRRPPGPDQEDALYWLGLIKSRVIHMDIGAVVERGVPLTPERATTLMATVVEGEIMDWEETERPLTPGSEECRKFDTDYSTSLVNNNPLMANSKREAAGKILLTDHNKRKTAIASTSQGKACPDNAPPGSQQNTQKQGAEAKKRHQQKRNRYAVKTEKKLG